MDTKDLVQSLLNGDKTEFKQGFEQLLYDRSKIALSDYKMEVAGSLMNNTDDIAEAERPYMDYEPIDLELEDDDFDTPTVNPDGREPEEYGLREPNDGLGGSEEAFIDMHGNVEVIDLLPESVSDDVDDIIDSGKTERLS